MRRDPEPSPSPVPTRLRFGCGTSMKIVYEPEHEQRSSTPLLKSTCPFRARLIADFSSLRVPALVPAPRPRTDPNASFHAAGVRLWYLHEDTARATLAFLRILFDPSANFTGHILWLRRQISLKISVKFGEKAYRSLLRWLGCPRKYVLYE